jgi:hypothetical protein
MGLALSGWMGFLVLAGVLLATRTAVAPGLGPLPESPIAKGGERDTGHKVVVKVQPAREPAPPPASGSSLYELRYEERRRVQERIGGVHELASLDVARPGLDWITSYRVTPPLRLVGIVGEGQRKGRLRPPPGGGVVVQATRHRHVAVLVVGRVAFYLSRLPSGSPGGREEKC